MVRKQRKNQCNCWHNTDYILSAEVDSSALLWCCNLLLLAQFRSSCKVVSVHCRNRVPWYSERYFPLKHANLRWTLMPTHNLWQWNCAGFCDKQLLLFCNEVPWVEVYTNGWLTNTAVLTLSIPGFLESPKSSGGSTKVFFFFKCRTFLTQTLTEVLSLIQASCNQRKIHHAGRG